MLVKKTTTGELRSRNGGPTATRQRGCVWGRKVGILVTFGHAFQRYSFMSRGKFVGVSKSTVAGAAGSAGAARGAAKAHTRHGPEPTGATFS